MYIVKRSSLKSGSDVDGSVYDIVNISLLDNYGDDLLTIQRLETPRDVCQFCGDPNRITQWVHITRLMDIYVGEDEVDGWETGWLALCDSCVDYIEIHAIKGARIVSQEAPGWLPDGFGSIPKGATKKIRIKISSKGKQPKLLSLGCDPEFYIFDDDGREIDARDVFEFSGSIGCDGSGDQLELRPQPGSPEEVVSSLKSLIREVGKIYDVGFNEYSSFGGHIHFGFGKPIEPASELLEVLDDFLGARTRHLLPRGKYGVPGDYETKKHGFEYRTPSSAIFSNPKIARISLKIVKCIVDLSGSIIEYHCAPIIDDYIKIGLTEDEASYFLKFIENYKIEKSILGYWEVTQDPGVFLVFKGTWDPDTMDKINSTVSSYFENVNVRIIISLFSLLKIVEEVNTIPVDGYGVISCSDSKHSIGVAESIRYGKDTDKFIKALISYIETLLREDYSETN